MNPKDVVLFSDMDETLLDNEKSGHSKRREECLL